MAPDWDTPAEVDYRWVPTVISANELEALLADIESDRVERTVSTTDTDKFAKAIAALANDLSDSGRPGYLIVGAHNDGRLAGIEITDTLLLGGRTDRSGTAFDSALREKACFLVAPAQEAEGVLAARERSGRVHFPFCISPDNSTTRPRASGTLRSNARATAAAAMGR